MNKISENKINIIRREKQGLGLLYGILAGTGYSLTAWGLDAVQLSQAHATLPWGKFVVGWLACLVLGGLAGWLAARLDNSLIAALIWAAAGCILGIGAGWLAYQGVVQLYDWFYPDIANQLDYSLNLAIQVRTGLAAVTSGFLGIAVGIAQLHQLDAALASAYSPQRLTSLIGGLVVFAIAGLATNGLVLANLRNPVIQVDNALAYAQDHRGQTLEIKEARQHAQTALRFLGELQYQPYRLFVSSYDEYLSVKWVTLDFGDVQTRCSVMEQSLTYCETPPGVKPSSPSEPTINTPGSSSNIPPIAGQSEDLSSSAPANTATPSVLQSNLAGELPAQLNRYQLQVTIEPELHSFQGVLHLDYTNTEETSLDSLFFRLLPNGQRSYGNGSLDVDWVRLNELDQSFQLSLENTVLELNLEQSLKPGDAAQIEIGFQGVVPQDFGNSESSSGYGIYNYSEGVMALASWYPILAVYDDQGWHLDAVSYIGDSVYSDMAYYEVEIELPQDQVLVSTGEIKQTGLEGDQQRYVVETGPVRDFFLIISARFTSLTAQAGETRINSYFLPENKAGGQRALEVAIQSLETYNRHFGAYPYTELDVVDAPMQNASGVEYPGIVLIGDDLYAENQETGFAVTVAHEVAHQWWYNLVGNDVFAEPWLDEALASYTSGLYLEAAQGKPGLKGLMSYYQDRYQRSVDSGSDHPISESLAYFENSASPNAYGGIVYAKGALFFDAVRQEIGDEAFFAGLQSYFGTYRYQIAAGEDLLATFESAAGRELDELFQTWAVSPQP